MADYDASKYNPPLKDWDTPGAMHRIAKGHPSYRFMQGAASDFLDRSAAGEGEGPVTNDRINAMSDYADEIENKYRNSRPSYARGGKVLNTKSYSKGGRVR